MERAADFQLLFCVWLDGPTRSRVGCVTFYWGERKRPILFCLQGVKRSFMSMDMMFYKESVLGERRAVKN